jgi:cation diffusion facilitator family transporter
MKAAWIEDILAIFPSIAFLVASRYFNKQPGHEFPYGYHKAYTVAFVASAFILLFLGIYLFIDSAISLIKAERATIGIVQIFSYDIWMGWLMILALLYSMIPAYFLGKKKLPIADKLHIKVLYVDAKMQKADWLSAGAAVAGIIGIGFGWWWADPVVAIIISFGIIKDGVEQAGGGMADLMEQVPKTMDDRELHPLLEQLKDVFLEEDWVKNVEIRVREHGLVFFGDIFVVPKTEENLMDNIEHAYEKARDLDWKIQDLVIHPVKELPNPNATFQEKHR